MDNFSVFGDDFNSCLAHLTKILEVCVRKRLLLSWEKSHFMVQEGVVLGHLVLGKCLEVDNAKIEVIQNLPLPVTLRDLRNFLGHVGFYHRFIRDFANHSSLQGYGLLHRQRRGARIRDVEARIDRSTDFAKSKLGLTFRDHVRRFRLWSWSGIGAADREEANCHLV